MPPAGPLQNLCELFSQCPSLGVFISTSSCFSESCRATSFAAAASVRVPARYSLARVPLPCRLSDRLRTHASASSVLTLLLLRSSSLRVLFAHSAAATPAMPSLPASPVLDRSRRVSVLLPRTPAPMCTPPASASGLWLSVRSCRGHCALRSTAPSSLAPAALMSQPISSSTCTDLFFFRPAASAVAPSSPILLWLKSSLVTEPAAPSPSDMPFMPPGPMSQCLSSSTRSVLVAFSSRPTAVAPSPSPMLLWLRSARMMGMRGRASNPLLRLKLSLGDSLRCKGDAPNVKEPPLPMRPPRGPLALAAAPAVNDSPDRIPPVNDPPEACTPLNTDKPPPDPIRPEAAHELPMAAALVSDGCAPVASASATAAIDLGSPPHSDRYTSCSALFSADARPLAICVRPGPPSLRLRLRLSLLSVLLDSSQSAMAAAALGPTQPPSCFFRSSLGALARVRSVRVALDLSATIRAW
mmetsp:Transcript_10965/g.26968  ORF Transcript_10965/g.26968 Transcript_10965/m.26968 type:complete len:469 (-) Transcript_10965:646-2052(-)